MALPRAWLQKIPLNQWLFLVALLAAALSLFEILDFYELPFESSLSSGSASQIFPELIAALLASGYLGLFILMLLENMALPIPSEVFLPMAGYLIYLGKMTFTIALTVSTIGGLIGSLIIFYLALILGRPLVYSLAGKIGVSKGSLLKSESWISGKGSIAILIARFVPGIRSSISIPAGALKMNIYRFSVVTVLGSFGWSLFLMYIGYSLGHDWRLASALSSSLLAQIFLYAVAIASITYVLYYGVQRYQGRKSLAMPNQKV